MAWCKLQAYFSINWGQKLSICVCKGQGAGVCVLGWATLGPLSPSPRPKAPQKGKNS